MKRLFVLCSVMIGLAASAASVWAQVANNTARVGTVVDSSGSAVVGAKISAVEESTGVVSPATTNAQGYYSIKFIAPGTYDITVEQAGFSKLTKTGTIVPIDQAVRTDFSLKAGAETQTVTVSASTPPISTDDATLGETFNTKAVADLPLIGHNALEIAATASNVTIGPSSSYSGVPPGEDFIGAGQREIQSSMTLDGVSIMNNLITVAPARPSSDMISEVQIQSGNYPAQYGSYLGLHVNLVSKSGTNDLHGSVYDYIQNTVFNAHDFFDAPGSPKQIQHYNQYGFSLGGPVYVPKLYNGRNKTFFFSSWEKLKQVSQSTGIASTLTSAERAGDFSAVPLQLTDPSTGLAYPNNQIPASELNSSAAMVSQKLEAYMLLPNLSGVQNNLQNSFPNNITVTQTLDRLDENIGDKVKLYLRYHWQDINVVSGTNFPTNNSYGPTNSVNYAIGYTQVIKPTLINDFRVGLNTILSDSLDYFEVNGPKDAGTALGIPGFNSDTLYGNPGIPSVYVDVLGNNNGPTLGNTTANWFQDDRTIDGYDEVSWTRGRHNIMAGAELRKLTIGREAANDARGIFNFAGTPGSADAGYTSTGYGAADFVLGLAQSSTTPIFPVKGSIGEWRDGFFVLDNWQVFPKLTLNYGLRYELPTVPYSLNGYTRILNADDTALIPASSAATPGEFKPTPGFKFIDPTHNNWAPRIGLAYRATESTVLRGGFGIYYNANQLNTYTLTTQNYPLSASVSYNGTAGSQLTFAQPTPGAASESPVAGVPGTYVSAVTMGPHLPVQTLYQWNLSWGQELWKGAGAELQYIGSHAIHLDRDFYNNSPLPGGPVGDINSRRPNQLFGRIRTIQNDEYSHYNGMTAILRQRLTHGLSGQASYTWAHDLDISDNSNNGGTTMNQYDINLDYGNSNWDIRNRFVAIATYDLPKFGGSGYLMQNTLGGWQVNAIVTLQSGIPYNVYLDNDQANVSQPNGNVQRPNWVHLPSANCTTKFYIANSTASCIDGSAFEYPAQFTYGTGGRNPLHGPGFENVNASIFKDFGIWERLHFQFRAEAQNVFNHPNLANPNSDMQGGWDPADPTTWGDFGTTTSTQKNSSGTSGRVLQLAGKIIF
ncbi:MAG: carboxypeptidase regulatory-like domain-containing protein [Acidobacteriaceae bacterium]